MLLKTNVEKNPARAYAAMFVKMNSLLHECGYVYEKKSTYLKSQVENKVRVQFDVEAALSGCGKTRSGGFTPPFARCNMQWRRKVAATSPTPRRQRCRRGAKTARVLSFMRFNPPVEGKVGVNRRCTARGPYDSTSATTKPTVVTHFEVPRPSWPCHFTGGTPVAHQNESLPNPQATCSHASNLRI